jgi:hypothetical protein
VTSEFNIGLARLRQFVARTGHTRVAANHVESSFSLGAWVIAQRADRHAGLLRPNQIRALERVPGWIWLPNPREVNPDPGVSQSGGSTDVVANARDFGVADSFATGFQLLAEYVQREGHARVTASHDERGYPLGRWVQRQRAKYRHRRLPLEQIRALETLPGWVWKHEPHTIVDARFERALGMLQAFVKVHGHARVPQEYRDQATGYALGAWVATRRYEHRRGLLTKRFVEQLSTVQGWAWGRGPARVQLSFDEYVRQFRDWLDRHGRPPDASTADGRRLLSWMSRTRESRRKASLTGEQIRVVDELARLSSELRADDDFRAALNALRAFADQHGNARVPNRHRTSGINLGNWTRRQKDEFSRSRLAPHRRQLLESVPGWTWNTRQDQFQRGLAFLRQFVRREGHARVPDDHVEDGYNLGPWVRDRKHRYRRAKLSADHARALEQIPGWSWNMTPADRFAAAVTLLRSFAEKHGHVRVPAGYVKDGINLFNWVSNRRSDFRAGRLSAERRRILESVPEWSW